MTREVLNQLLKGVAASVHEWISREIAEEVRSTVAAQFEEYLRQRDRILSASEVAAHLRISKNEVIDALNSDKMAGYQEQSGRKQWRVRLGDADHWFYNIR